MEDVSEDRGRCLIPKYLNFPCPKWVYILRRTLRRTLVRTDDVMEDVSEDGGRRTLFLYRKISCHFLGTVGWGEYGTAGVKSAPFYLR